MRRIMPVLFLVVGGAFVYLYMTGKLSGVTANAGDAGAIAQQGSQIAQQKAAEFYAQPWFWELAISAAAATGLVMLWRRMSGPVRGVVIAAGGAALVLLATTGGHR